MDDDATPTPPRPHQRARLDCRTPSPRHEDAVLYQQWQAVALPPVLQGQELEPQDASLPSFDAFLHNTGLTREELQSPFPLLDHYRLQRAEHAAAQPPPRDREHRLLPEPTPGIEHFAAAPPRPLELLLQPYHPPPPEQRRPWVLWRDMSAAHREAQIASEEFEDCVVEVRGRLEGLIGRARWVLGGF